MKRKFEYSKTEYETICEECMLNKEERIILKLRCEGNTAFEIIDILEEMGNPMSTSTLSRKIAKIDNKIKKHILKEGLP